MKPGDIVHPVWKLPLDLYDVPIFTPKYRRTLPEGLWVGIVLGVKESIVYGTNIHLLTPYGTGWTHLDNLNVIL